MVIPSLIRNDSLWHGTLGTNSSLVGENVIGLGILYTSTAGFYSDVVECLPVDQVTQVRFLAGIGYNIFAL